MCELPEMRSPASIKIRGQLGLRASMRPFRLGTRGRRTRRHLLHDGVLRLGTYRSLDVAPVFPHGVVLKAVTDPGDGLFTFSKAFPVAVFIDEQRIPRVAHGITVEVQ